MNMTQSEFDYLKSLILARYYEMPDDVFRKWLENLTYLSVKSEAELLKIGKLESATSNTIIA